MNNKDLEIISHLRQNARMPLTIMSKKTRIPVSTIFGRLKTHADNVIAKHTSLLNFALLGYYARANITIKVDRDDKQIVKEYLTKHQAVNSLYKINNGYDFMIEGVFRQVSDMENFLDELENKFRISDRKSFFIIEDLKREAFLCNPHLAIME
jgi:Lrp/AsnC family transcriptional regulator, leucine-responsive regulatory protein